MDLLVKKSTTVSQEANPSELDIFTLMELPQSLRKTVMALYKLKRATASEISKETGRKRALESALANELVRLGYVAKERASHDVYFKIESSKRRY
ncbi:MAG: MarR family transcriptional regulator [Candidatus Bathyarchaeota archaeon]|nr:MarR family transcriptional regulator [Candidatus Bathyarchaeota archaeon]